MKLAKSILCGVAALGITAGAAGAQDEDYSSPNASNSDATYVFADPSSDGQVAWADSPSLDVLIIEPSDTLAYYGPSDTDLEYNSVD